jgi:RNA polymerase sigma-70 factor (ECF subfamily)
MRHLSSNWLNSCSDAELVSGFLQNRNNEWLGELFGRYIHLVFGVCIKYLKDRGKAEDMVILIYEKIQNEIDRHEIRNFKSWLYVVTKNLCLMELRKAENKAIHFVPDEKIMDYYMENAPELHPLDNEEKISDKALDGCIEKLKLEQKECIKQFYFENRCYREIADLLNIEEKEVKSRLQNAKRNLKICLEKFNLK